MTSISPRFLSRMGSTKIVNAPAVATIRSAQFPETMAWQTPELVPCPTPAGRPRPPAELVSQLARHAGEESGKTATGAAFAAGGRLVAPFPFAFPFGFRAPGERSL